LAQRLNALLRESLSRMVIIKYVVRLGRLAYFASASKSPADIFGHRATTPRDATPSTESSWRCRSRAGVDLAAVENIQIEIADFRRDQFVE
jgi:hypothetical protein